ncbi:MAG: thioredoxin family protein [Pseudomonadota bacterium]
MLLNTPICDFGWPAVEFKLKDFAGVPVAMRDHVTEKGLLVIFMCNHCPYVKAVATRLSEDTAQLMDEGFGVLGVMSNDYISYPADAPARMAEFAEQHGFKFPYLVDEDQSVARTYDAICTPDFFGFNGKAELQYRGRLDDLRMGDEGERAPELLNAMRQIGDSGQGPIDQIASMGCSIKWRS